MAKQQLPESFYDQIKQTVDENKGNVEGWRRWIGPAVLTIAGGVVIARSLFQSGVLQAMGSSGSTATVDSDEYMVRCRSCGDLVDEDGAEDGLCEDCLDSDGTTYCCGMMYTDGEQFCRSCGDPL